MAKECSFDVVSQVDMQEVDNAYQQAKKEIANRYDLKKTNSTLTLDKGQMTMTIQAPSDFIAGQIIDVVSTKLVKRGVDLGAVQWGKSVDASGGTVKKTANIVAGIDKEKASAISKDIRNQKFKAKVQVEGDKLRVSSASKDVLQSIIAFLKEKDYGQPLQYVNYR